jgi:hypothetical protein
LLAPWWALALPACVAPRAFTFEVVELELELQEGQSEVGFEIVLDIRDGAMPDPEVYDGDRLWVDVSVPGRIDVDVSLDRQPKPAKGGRGRGGRIFELNDIAQDCPLDDGCQRVVAVTVTRERLEPNTLWLWADFRLWTTQGAINVFPSRATEQEIRLRAFED